jgi:hypothetical protein
MRRDLERRLRAVERKGLGGFETWIHVGDGMVRSFSGEVLTREEAEARTRATGNFSHFISEGDLFL